MSRDVLEPILAHVRAEPSRTWSIIITLYGDAIVPRGGSVWLGTLLSFFRALDVNEGVVRTAMSRLAADGWLERRRVGRNSFYRLSAKGEVPFRVAALRIYSARPAAWNGQFELILLDNGSDRDAAKAAFEAAQLGTLAPAVWLAHGGSVVPETGPLLRLQLAGDAETNRKLAARSWPLAAMRRAYAAFIAAFTPLRRALEKNASLSALDALAARILLIHQYRRIVLRDPLLPPDILPEDWPGAQARALCSAVYRTLLPASEAWLDGNVLDETGAALPADPAVFGRFEQ